MTARWYKLCRPIGLAQCATCARNEDRDPAAASDPAQKWIERPALDALGRRCGDHMPGDPPARTKP